MQSYMSNIWSPAPHVEESPPVCESTKERARILVQPAIEIIPTKPDDNGHCSNSKEVLKKEGEYYVQHDDEICGCQIRSKDYKKKSKRIWMRNNQPGGEKCRSETVINCLISSDNSLVSPFPCVTP